MSREEMELATLGFLNAVNPEEVPLVDLVVEDRREEIEALTVASALERMVETSDLDDPVDQLWLARALVDGQRSSGTDDVQPEARLVANHLLSPFNPVDGEEAAQALVEAILLLRPQEPLSSDALEMLQLAFGDSLHIAGDVRDAQIFLSGPAGRLATLLLELATHDLTCKSSSHTIEVGGHLREVVFVEVDACTNRTFDECKRSIDPTKWPDVNPFFVSVKVIGPITKSGADWCGVVKEVVGPGINLRYYETDLAITYLERPGQVITAFGLAPNRNDDGKVTVDRGFVSCTEEGLHRRIRTLKVYRIEGLSTPPSWICPLWSWQLALSNWWSA